MVAEHLRSNSFGGLGEMQGTRPNPTLLKSRCPSTVLSFAYVVLVVGAVLALSRPMENEFAVMVGYEMESLENYTNEVYENYMVNEEKYYKMEPKTEVESLTALPYQAENEKKSLTALPYQAEGECEVNLTALPYQVGEIKELYGKILSGLKELKEKLRIEVPVQNSMKILLTLCMLIAVLRMRETEELEVKEIALVQWLVKVATGVQLVRSVCLASSPKRNSSRLEKRRCHLSMRERRKHLRVLMFVAMVSHARCMDQQVFMERIAEMTQAATRAAAAAAQASDRLQASRSSASGGLETASKVLKSPETFSGDNPLDFLAWKTSFETWLGFADEKYSDLLEKVEKLTRKPVMSTYSEEQQGVARKFFAILSSHLRGRCGSLVRAHSKDKDGFALWYDLLGEFLPSTKQRSLSLAQALSQYPNFSGKQSMMESILQFEQLVQAYETSSSQTYPKDLMTATLLRCAPTKIRDHLQLSLREDSSYADVREAMLSYERVTRGYTQEQIMKTLTSDHSADATVPMEVDRVKGDYKGKGDHGKGKDKGRGKGWWSNMWSFGRGRGKGRGRGFKGGGKKGKSKGKSKGKGKDKGHKGGKSKGKNKGECFNCGDPNHFSRDCPRRRNWQGGVNQVEQEQFEERQQPVQPQQGQTRGQDQQQYFRQSTPGTQTTQTTYRGSTTSSNSTVRRVFHLGLVPGTGSVNMVTDLFYEWLEGEVNDDGTPTSTSTTSSKTVEVEENEDDVEWVMVRMANQVDAVILDSGSDANVLPKSYASDNILASKHRLRNCEGTPLKTYGTRETELVVTTANGEEVVLKQKFVVGEVTNCLLSLGQLLKTGWSLVHRGEHGEQLALQSPEGSVEVPVYYKGSSLAMDAWIRCVNEEPQGIHEEEEELEVRVLVSMKTDFDADVFGLWHATSDGKVYKKYRGRDYEDGRMMWGEYRPYRTTLRRPMGSQNNEWELIEHSQNYIEKDDSGGPIEECKDEDFELLAILSNTVMELSDIADILGNL